MAAGWSGKQVSGFDGVNIVTDHKDRNLMAPDDFKNLGFGTEKPKPAFKEPEKGVKGELHW